MSHSLEAYHKRFEDLSQFIEDAIYKADSGEVSDLGSLEIDVMALCNEVRKINSEDAQTLAPQIANLISKMDELAMALSMHQRRERKLYD